MFLQEGHAYMKRRANRSANNAPLNHVKDSLPVFFEVHETLTGKIFFANDLNTRLHSPSG